MAIDTTQRQKIVDIFNDYYGEDEVDLQDNKIFIHFPKVTVTNEYDRSTVIHELYVKIELDNNNYLIGTFGLNRAKYTSKEIQSGYLHSHVNIRNFSDIKNYRVFSNPCLGTGPIRNTCLTLNNSFDEDIWRLFAYELSIYVKTESLVGGPYIKLENIGASNYLDQIKLNLDNISNISDINENSDTIRKFILYIIEKKPFHFGFVRDKYIIADSEYNILIKTSNLFIEWYNNLSSTEQLEVRRDLDITNSIIKCKVSNKKLFKLDYISPLTDSHIHLFNFKGYPIYLNIINVEECENTSNILHPKIVRCIINKMLKPINCNYSHESNKKTIYI